MYFYFYLFSFLFLHFCGSLRSRTRFPVETRYGVITEWAWADFGLDL